MLEQYFPILLFILVGVGIGMLLLTVGTLVAPDRPDAGLSVAAADACINVTVSIGVAGYPRSATDEDSLFRSADAALYDAKRHGKDRVFIAPATS